MRRTTYARIALTAQLVDVFQISNGIDAATREVRRRSDQKTVKAFEKVSARSGVWEILRSAVADETLAA